MAGARNKRSSWLYDPDAGGVFYTDAQIWVNIPLPAGGEGRHRLQTILELAVEGLCPTEEAYELGEELAYNLKLPPPQRMDAIRKLHLPLSKQSKAKLESIMKTLIAEANAPSPNRARYGTRRLVPWRRPPRTPKAPQRETPPYTAREPLDYGSVQFEPRKGKDLTGKIYIEGQNFTCGVAQKHLIHVLLQAQGKPLSRRDVMEGVFSVSTRPDVDFARVLESLDRTLRQNRPDARAFFDLDEEWLRIVHPDEIGRMVITKKPDDVDDENKSSSRKKTDVPKPQAPSSKTKKPAKRPSAGPRFGSAAAGPKAPKGKNFGGSRFLSSSPPSPQPKVLDRLSPVNGEGAGAGQPVSARAAFVCVISGDDAPPIFQCEMGEERKTLDIRSEAARKMLDAILTDPDGVSRDDMFYELGVAGEEMRDALDVCRFALDELRMELGRQAPDLRDSVQYSPARGFYTTADVKDADSVEGEPFFIRRARGCTL